MPRLAFSSLRVRIAGLVLLALLPALVAMLYTARINRRHAEQRVHQDGRDRVHRVTGSFEQMAEGVRHLLVALARLPSVRGIDGTACSAQLADLLKEYPHLVNLGVIRPDGSVFASALPSAEGVNLADRSYFRRAMETRRFSVGGYQVGRIARIPTINFGNPVLDAEGEPVAVVYAAMDIARLSAGIEMLLPLRSVVLLSDRTGMVMAVLAEHPDPDATAGKPLPADFLESLRSYRAEGCFERENPRGESYLYEFAPLPSTGGDAHVIVGFSRDAAFADVNRDLAWNLAALALVAILALAAAWFGGDLLVLRRVRDMAGAAERLRAGDLSVRVEPGSSGNELDRLARVFNEMSESLQRRQGEAEQARVELQSRIDLQKAIAAISAHFINLDADSIDGGIQNTLQAVGTLTGADRAAVIQVREAQAQDITHEWCAPGVPPRRDRMERKPLGVFPGFADRIQRFETVQVPRVEDLPPESPERAALRAEGVRSLLVVPMKQGRKLLGLLAIESVREEKAWSDDAVEFLRIAGETVVGALERRRFERALRQSEERYRYVFERSIQGILIHQDEVIRYANPAALQLLGHDRTEDLIGRSIWESVVAPEEQAAQRERAAKVLRGEPVPAHFGWQACRKDGTRIWVQSTVSLVTWEHRPAVCAFLLNITERKLAEEALREQQQEQQVIFDSVPAMIWYRDAEGRILRANRTAAASCGLTPKDLEGRRLEEIYPDEAARYRDDDLEVIRTGRPKLGILEHLQVSSGEKICVRTDKVPYRDERGAIVGVIAVSTDITERVRAEEAQRERSEQMLRQQASLLRLAQSDPGDFEAFLLRVTEEAAETLGVARVCVWRFTEDRAELVCEEAWRRAERRHERGGRHRAKEVQRFLRALEESRTVAASDARTDPATTDLVTAATAPQGIASLLGAAILLGGRVVGVVGFEHAGAPRTWSAEDQNYATSVADLVSLALAASDRKRAEDQLRNSEALYHSLVENIPQFILRKDRQGRLTFANSRYCATASKTLPELLGRSDHDLYPRELADKYRQDDLRVMESGQVFDAIEDHLLPGGERIYVHVVKSPLRDAAGRVIGIQGIFWDVTSHKRAEEALAQERNLLYILMDNSPDTIYFKDRESRFIRINRAMARRFGLDDPAAAVGKMDADFFTGEHAREAYADEQEVVRTGQPLIGKEEKETWPDGTETWVSTTKIPFRDPAGQVAGIFGISRNITERKRAEQELFRRAFYDGLTGLPNRSLFLDRLAHALRRARRRDHYFAVLFLDLDRFKDINDSLGHLIGDQFLVAIARRLESCLRPGDTVARLGGDEFVVLLEEIEDLRGAVAVADRILQDLPAPVNLQGQEVCTTTSIGIAPVSPEYDNPEDLLRDADTAMYRAKEAGRARHMVYDPAMHAHVVRRLQMETDLRRAVERGEFRVRYQPILTLASGRIAGVEALVRWLHPQRGLLAPADFIHAAEDNGLIVPIGMWVLRESCRQAREWQSRFPTQPPLTISVNVSARQFAQPDLLHQVGQILQETGLDANTLTLEITETALMQNFGASAALFTEMKALHIQLNLDDFGTGYSSLSYLHRFPVSVLKIHHSFVSRLDASPEHEEIVRTIITLARNLRMNVIAEGVESAEQLRRLRALQCGLAQGYFIAPPLEPEAVSELLASGRTW
jgi:diguanylate cyclase (GGDEF)-like protein/PAS domain S-box-containing protein